jgi:hypothetical protein
MKAPAVAALFALSVVSGFAGGMEESSGGMVAAAAATGAIRSRAQVRIDSLLGAVNQSYPEPEESLGIIARSGHYQRSGLGQTELLRAP